MSDVDYRDDDQTDPGGTSVAPPRTPSPDEQVQQRWPTQTWTPPRQPATGLGAIAAQVRAPTQAPQQPQRVAPDQSVDPSQFTPGTPGPSGGMPGPSGGGAPNLPPFGPFGLPPFQRAPRQHFIPSMPNRPPHMWGMPRRFPMLPRMWELPGIFNGIGRSLAQWGSAGVAPFAAQLGQHSGAWMKGYMQGQEALARLQHQKMTMASQQLELNLENELREYGSIFAIFGDDPKRQGQLEQALRNAAQKFGDQHMLEALNTTGVQGAHNLVNWLDAKHGDLRVSNRVLQKQQADLESMKPWLSNPVGPTGLPERDVTRPWEQQQQDQEGIEPVEPIEPGAPGGAAGAEPGAEPGAEAPTEGAEPAAPPEGATLNWGSGDVPPQEHAEAGTEAPEQQVAAVGMSPLEDQGDQPEPTDQEMQGARSRLAAGLRGQGAPQQRQMPTAQQPPAPRAPSSPVLDEAARANIPGIAQHLDPNGINWVAEQMLLGQMNRTAMSKLPKPVLGWALRREAEMTAELDGIANRGLQGRQALEAIRNVSPAMASGIEDLVAGRRAPPSNADLNRQPWNRAYHLAQLVDPNLDPNSFKLRQKTMLDAAPGGKLGTQGRFIKSAFDLLNKTITAVQNQPALIDELAAAGGRLTEIMADPQKAEQYTIIRSMIIDSIAETEKAVTGGKPTQTERSRQEEATNLLTQNPHAVIGQLKGRFMTLSRALDGIRETYRTNTGLDPNRQFGPLTPQEQRAIDEVNRQIEGEVGPGLPPGVTIKKIE